MLKLAALLAALALTVSGCSQAQDAADSASEQASRQAADSAAAAKAKAAREAADAINGAKSRASQGVANAIRTQLCSLTEDGAISPAELKSLPPLLDHAARIGVSPDLVTPLQQAVARGKAAKAQIQRAEAACQSGN